MRWVDRGPEPQGVEFYRSNHTQPWVDHFRKGMGQRSPDLENHWRNFRPELGRRFFNKCGYCERFCEPEVNHDRTPTTPTVDHFQPVNRFPQLVYVWNNWVYCCKQCNDEKDGDWPNSGFVDPCAETIGERPERYLDIDVVTGEIIANAALDPPAKIKAQNTIEYIGLNAFNLLIYRMDALQQFKAYLVDFPETDRQDLIDLLTGADKEYSGSICKLVEHLRQAGQI